MTIEDNIEYADLDMGKGLMITPRHSGGYVVTGINGCFAPGEALTWEQALERLLTLRDLSNPPNGAT